jgi:hypothetical protein
LKQAVEDISTPYREVNSQLGQPTLVKVETGEGRASSRTLPAFTQEQGSPAREDDEVVERAEQITPAQLRGGYWEIQEEADDSADERFGAYCAAEHRESTSIHELSFTKTI